MSKRNWKLFVEKSGGKVTIDHIKGRVRALEALRQGKPVPPDTKAADWPTTPRLRIGGQTL